MRKKDLKRSHLALQALEFLKNTLKAESIELMNQKDLPEHKAWLYRSDAMEIRLWYIVVRPFRSAGDPKPRLHLYTNVGMWLRQFNGPIISVDCDNGRRWGISANFDPGREDDSLPPEPPLPAFATFCQLHAITDDLLCKDVAKAAAESLVRNCARTILGKPLLPSSLT